MTPARSLLVEQYQVGVVCALPDEMSAAIAMLDERHQRCTVQDKLDSNNYVLGRIHEHNVVVSCLPAGAYGTVSAARVANDMLRTFPGLRFGLMVGIGGGIPNLSKGLDIRLGDVVISQPDKTYGGVVQYDLRKNLGKAQFEQIGVLKPPPTILLSALATLRADHNLCDSAVPDILADTAKTHPKLLRSGYGFPDEENDALYCPQCDGSGASSSCLLCADGEIERPTRGDHNPTFWYGVIASGNELMKNATERDRIGQEFGALCVEMEAAGLMNGFPCIVIRGICDYADSHKNDAWQKYAALTAAAYAKELLGYVSPEQTKLEQPVQGSLASLEGHLIKQSSLAEEHLREFKEKNVKHEQHYHDDQYRQCCRTFKTSKYEQLKNFNPARVEGTCQWVLSHPRYLQWLDNSYDGLLWISADPGCGKSVLARSLVDNELRNSDQQTVCYFFFKEYEEQDNAATALCALLHQLFSQQPRLISHAIPAWEKSGDKVAKEEAELWHILLAAARVNKTHRVICVLDALDECRSSDRRWLIEMLSRFHAHASASHTSCQPGRLKFLVTSRPYDDISTEFQKAINDLPTIRLRGEEENEQIRREIDLVIRMRVSELSETLRLDGDTKDQLERNLLEMKHRTYLWLYLAIESIRKTYRNSLRLEEASMKSLPSSVEDAYEKILGRVDQEQRGNVKMILHIVVGARRPLHVEEMAIALGIATSSHSKSLHKSKLDPGRLENNVRDWCGLFVFIDHGRIFLIHQTAKEFLLKESGCTASPSRWKNCLNPPETGREMARICMEFLSSDDIGATADSLTRKLRRTGVGFDVQYSDYVESFLAYSAEHWPSHLRDACLSTNDSTLSQIVAFYEVEGRLYKLWFPIFWMVTGFRESPCPEMNAIQLGGLLGHESMLLLMLQRKKDHDIDESDWLGHTALIWASKYGHERVVQILLDHGANVDTREGICGTALYLASEHGHEKVVRRLLDHGADVNRQSGLRGTALDAASSRGLKRTVQILLDHGADVNIQGGQYGTALQAASQNGHETVAQILLDHGADVNIQDARGNALYSASEHGHEKIVQILLDHKADINTQGGRYGTALQAAALHRSTKVMQMLLDHGADVNIQGGEFGNAIQAASFRGHEKIVRILLEHGTDVNIQGGQYGTALQAASLRGHERVVQILLSHKANVNTQGGLYSNALYAASSYGYEKVVQVLLNHGADVNTQGGRYGTALQAAALHGSTKVMQMLLDHGAEVNIQGGEFGNAIQAASFHGHEKIVRILLEHGTDINTPRELYGTALQVASSCGYERVVQILLDHGAKVNTQGGKFGSALQVASLCGHKAVIQLLLEHGADVNARGGECGTALQAASQNGHEQVVQILLDHGADVNARGGEYGTALQAASQNGHEQGLKKLLLSNETREASITMIRKEGFSSLGTEYCS
ncbi:hypothetical protein H2200_008119 [Cladophialophora chaetospira]|uniref:NACHT domain-containing protein n=1 Tax=Cladophialophora chaetospira TaxID=386627 RepID=A0AA39CG46_9EURO|nr:hypothetical protein H2200_008119 [Cladophialophora chaetospira]